MFIVIVAGQLISLICGLRFRLLFFFFNDPATTEIYTLSLHDALPILLKNIARPEGNATGITSLFQSVPGKWLEDRKSTRLNSSHANISYAVFCLKKKKKRNRTHSKLHRTIITTTTSKTSNQKSQMLKC